MAAQSPLAMLVLVTPYTILYLVNQRKGLPLYQNVNTLATASFNESWNEHTDLGGLLLFA